MSAPITATTPETEFNGYVDDLTTALGGNRGAALVLAQNPGLCDRLERVGSTNAILRLGVRRKRIATHAKSLEAVRLSLRYEPRWRDREELLSRFEARFDDLLADLQQLADSDEVLIRREHDLLAQLDSETVQ